MTRSCRSGRDGKHSKGTRLVCYFLYCPSLADYLVLGRAHAILTTFLPPTLLPALLPPSPREEFLDCLSSGQLLCVAYNTCVRKSKKPWGYISRDGIHDIVALEQAARDDDPDDTKAQAEVKKGWTFRRIDNLRLWAGYAHRPFCRRYR